MEASDIVRIVGEADLRVLAGVVEPVTLSTRLFDTRRGAHMSDGSSQRMTGRGPPSAR